MEMRAGSEVRRPVAVAPELMPQPQGRAALLRARRELEREAESAGLRLTGVRYRQDHAGMRCIIVGRAEKAASKPPAAKSVEKGE